METKFFDSRALLPEILPSYILRCKSCGKVFSFSGVLADLPSTCSSCPSDFSLPPCVPLTARGGVFFVESK